MATNINSKDMFTMRKFLKGYVNQERFFKKKTDARSDIPKNDIVLAKLPPIIARLADRIHNINFKYKSKPIVEKKRNRREVSLPVLKYTPQENEEQLRMIRRLIDTTPSRCVVKDETKERSMIAYNKISTLMMP